MPGVAIQALTNSVVLNAGQYTTVLTLPSNALSLTVNFRLISLDLTVNKHIRTYAVPSAFLDGTTPPADVYVLHPKDMVLGPAGLTVGFLEDTNIVLAPGSCIVAYCQEGNMVARAHGLARIPGL